jgi:large subunit ribosomal protein L4
MPAPASAETLTETLAPEDVTVDVRTPDGATKGTVVLPGAIFDVQVNIPLIHQVVVAQLAAARQGTHSTKTRGEVQGGGRKPYKQKGTGRARQGSTRAPQFTGGGVVHGPHPRDYSQRTPKKMKAAALRGALSDRARNARVHVVTGVVDGETPSTKAAVQALAHVSDRRHVLVVVERDDVIAWKSLQNVDRVHLLVPDQLNTYDVLVSDDVVFTQGALAVFLDGPRKGKSVKAVASSLEIEAEIEAPVEVTKPKATKPKATKPKATKPKADTEAVAAAETKADTEEASA